MGWTHYWERDSELPKEAFEKAAKDCLIVCAAIDVSLAGPEFKCEPVFSETEISFNGTKGQDCELFSIKASELPRRPGRAIFSYCKTEKLPYDLCVKCVLVILKHYLGEHIQVKSDGTDEDWRDAKRLCQSCLGYGPEFVLSVDD
jgi:hypothetical protein